jgi:transcriptional regulator with AAA-type ATPase domain
MQFRSARYGKEKAMTARKSKKKRATAGREYKLRLPPALSKRIEKDAEKEGKPQSRIVIEDLESIPYLRSRAHFEDLVKDMEHTLGLYSARVHATMVTDNLLNAVKEAVKANKAGNIAELRRQVDRLGLVLFEWEQFEQLSSASKSKSRGGGR